MTFFFFFLFNISLSHFYTGFSAGLWSALRMICSCKHFLCRKQIFPVPGKCVCLFSRAVQKRRTFNAPSASLTEPCKSEWLHCLPGLSRSLYLLGGCFHFWKMHSVLQDSIDLGGGEVQAALQKPIRIHHGLPPLDLFLFPQSLLGHWRLNDLLLNWGVFKTCLSVNNKTWLRLRIQFSPQDCNSVMWQSENLVRT